MPELPGRQAHLEAGEIIALKKAKRYLVCRPSIAFPFCCTVRDSQPVSVIFILSDRKLSEELLIPGGSGSNPAQLKKQKHGFSRPMLLFSGWAVGNDQDNASRFLACSATPTHGVAVPAFAPPQRKNTPPDCFFTSDPSGSNPAQLKKQKHGFSRPMLLFSGWAGGIRTHG